MTKYLFPYCLVMLLGCRTMQPVPRLQYDQYPVYTGSDLGLTANAQGFSFKVWTPAAESVRLLLYDQPMGGAPLQVILLDKTKQGVWGTQVGKTLKNKYYTIQVKIEGNWLDETPDPYAKVVGTNGLRGMVADLADTNPKGWENDRRPAQKAFTDIILYELHVRDLSSNPNAGIQNKGKFLGLTELGTRSPEGLSTGLSHLKELGITHVHLLPSFDFRSLDESLPYAPERYNWGYDPENYNAPEGSYSTNPADGKVRVREFKQLVQALHAQGIRVVMDVVYNHTGTTEKSVFNRTAPGYYYRHTADGKWSNASACGNETASERPMMRQYMVESMLYWAKEYHIDGFRVDLMGIHDIETMNQVSQTLHQLDPTIFVYGEGWTAGSSPLPDAQRALKANTLHLDRVAAFSDDFRDALKGSVFEHKDRGFVSGKPGMEESIKFGIVASTQHPQVNYGAVNYSKAPWAKEPYQTITYAECHDNHTLWDRLSLSRPDASEADRVRMHRLTVAMILTAQGVSFLHAGIELLRTKQGVENSFESPDAINHMDWSRKKQYQGAYEYIRQLIALRKQHPAFRLPNTASIQQNLRFLDITEQNLIAYTLNGKAVGDPWGEILVIYNGNAAPRRVNLPSGSSWQVGLDDSALYESNGRTIAGPNVEVPGISVLVLHRK